MATARKRHVVLSSHPRGAGTAPAIHWGAATARERGPVVASEDPAHRNAIGAHAGSYAVYRALAIAAGQLSKWAAPERVIVVSAIPKTSVGKIDKMLIRAELAAQG